VKYREDELNRSLEANKVETEAIVEMRARVDKMIDFLQELLHISQQCLVKRSASTRRSAMQLIVFHSILLGHNKKRHYVITTSIFVRHGA